MYIKNLKHNWIFFTGLALIAIGLAVMIDQFLRTDWLILFVIPVIGLIFLATGVLIRKIGYIITGCLVLFTGLGFIAGMHWFPSVWYRILGASLVGLSIGWVAISLLSVLFTDNFLWWPLIPAGVILSIAAVFLYTDLSILEFIYFIGLGTGVVFLGIGIYKKLFGLIIPGCLLSGISPGIYFAWARNMELNGLAQTGQMLVWFALGWGLITLFSRVITDKFIWWPLIPGGVLATVGWGLYIGGNPENAMAFISNSGSVGIIIFGLYLLLLRRGIQR